MDSSLQIGCIILASGASHRFGENKLLAQLNGKSLIRRTLDAVPTACVTQTAVVSPYAEILRLAEEYRFRPVPNDRPQDGVSHTIELGLAALNGCDGALFLVSDQPLLRRETTEALCHLWLTRPDSIAACAHQGTRGNPCLFPARLFPELRALTGDTGGSAVIRRHLQELILLETAAAELMDTDTPEALDAMR